jgi:hypothetical protein
MAFASGTRYFFFSFHAPTERVEENAKASTVTLDRSLLEKIDKIARPGLAKGATLL